MNKDLISPKEIPVSEKLVSYCGLYCGACARYLKASCPGCAESNSKVWCNIRNCCVANKYHSCADCKEFSDYERCKKFNNLIAKFFSWVFRSDRKAGVEKIKQEGRAAFAKYMAEKRLHAMKK